MTKTVCIFGRQPELGLAEVESLFGVDAVQPVGNIAAIIDIDPCVFPFRRLGGSTRMAKLLTVLPTNTWEAVEKFGVQSIPEHVQYVPEGKFTLGVSAYGFGVSASKINATALTFKKAVRAVGRNTRIVPNKAPELSTAQVLHNKLTDPTAWELLFIKNGNSTVVAQTVLVQDIEAYAKRDQARPKRDARVGMLPPKLAQIIINLAAGIIPTANATDESKNNVWLDDSIVTQDQTVLDPFCGTGVVLQESLLMGYHAYGSDLDERMINYSIQNIDWLKNMADLPQLDVRIEPGDATSHRWQAPITMVAGETYLGRPFGSTPHPDVLQKVVQDVSKSDAPTRLITKAGSSHRDLVRDIEHQKEATSAGVPRRRGLGRLLLRGAQKR